MKSEKVIYRGKVAEMGVERGNRRYGGEGAYTDVRNRVTAPHVASIRAHIRRLNESIEKELNRKFDVSIEFLHFTR